MLLFVGVIMHYHIYYIFACMYIGEPPGTLLGEAYLTPISLWFQRNHHPMPRINPQEYSLTISIAPPHTTSTTTAKSDTSTNNYINKQLRTYTLHELKTLFPKVEVVSTIQCGGNRRADMSQHKRTAGNAWGVCAISNAKWGGVRLADVIAHATKAIPIVSDTTTSSSNSISSNTNGNSNGLTYQQLYEAKVASMKDGNEVPGRFPRHVHFISYDQLIASIPIEKAINYCKFSADECCMYLFGCVCTQVCIYYAFILSNIMCYS